MSKLMVIKYTKEQLEEMSDEELLELYEKEKAVTTEKPSSLRPLPSQKPLHINSDVTICDVERELLLAIHEGMDLNSWLIKAEVFINQNGGVERYPAGKCHGTKPGTREPTRNCCGDLNGDGSQNVLDVVTLVNCVLALAGDPGGCAELEFGCAGDMNDDGGWNVLDVVTLVNCILAGTCDCDACCNIGDLDTNMYGIGAWSPDGGHWVSSTDTSWPTQYYYQFDLSGGRDGDVITINRENCNGECGGCPYTDCPENYDYKPGSTTKKFRKCTVSHQCVGDIECIIPNIDGVPCYACCKGEGVKSQFKCEHMTPSEVSGCIGHNQENDEWTYHPQYVCDNCENCGKNNADNTHSCYKAIPGCTNSFACNYCPTCDVPDDSCEFPPEGYDCDGVGTILGCTDEIAGNYCTLCNNDDGTCCYGCGCPEVCESDNFGGTCGIGSKIDCFIWGGGDGGQNEQCGIYGPSGAYSCNPQTDCSWTDTANVSGCCDPESCNAVFNPWGCDCDQTETCLHINTVDECGICNGPGENYYCEPGYFYVCHEQDCPTLNTCECGNHDPSSQCLPSGDGWNGCDASHYPVCAGFYEEGEDNCRPCSCVPNEPPSEGYCDCRWGASHTCVPTSGSCSSAICGPICGEYNNEVDCNGSYIVSCGSALNFSGDLEQQIEQDILGHGGKLHSLKDKPDWLKKVEDGNITDDKVVVISTSTPLLPGLKKPRPIPQELDACLEEERLLTNFPDEGGLELWIKELEAHITQYGGVANYPAGECFGTTPGTSQTRSTAYCGDMNNDGGHNVLDIVGLANCVLAANCAVIEHGCAGDLNQDGGWNVLDIVTLVNCVLAANCGESMDCCGADWQPDTSGTGFWSPVDGNFVSSDKYSWPFGYYDDIMAGNVRQITVGGANRDDNCDGECGGCDYDTCPENYGIKNANNNKKWRKCSSSSQCAADITCDVPAGCYACCKGDISSGQDCVHMFTNEVSGCEAHNGSDWSYHVGFVCDKCVGCGTADDHVCESPPEMCDDDFGQNCECGSLVTCADITNDATNDLCGEFAAGSACLSGDCVWVGEATYEGCCDPTACNAAGVPASCSAVNCTQNETCLDWDECGVCGGDGWSCIQVGPGGPCLDEDKPWTCWDFLIDGDGTCVDFSWDCPDNPECGNNYTCWDGSCGDGSNLWNCPDNNSPPGTYGTSCEADSDCRSMLWDDNENWRTGGMCGSTASNAPVFFWSVPCCEDGTNRCDIGCGGGTDYIDVPSGESLCGITIINYRPWYDDGWPEGFDCSGPSFSSGCNCGECTAAGDFGKYTASGDDDTCLPSHNVTNDCSDGEAGDTPDDCCPRIQGLGGMPTDCNENPLCGWYTTFGCLSHECAEIGGCPQSCVDCAFGGDCSNCEDPSCDGSPSGSDGLRKGGKLNRGGKPKRGRKTKRERKVNIKR